MKRRRIARYQLAIPPCTCGAVMEETVVAYERAPYVRVAPTRLLRETRCQICRAWVPVRARAYQLARLVVPQEAATH